MVLIFIYSYSPYKLDFLGYYHKIWAHRTNSVEKLNSALSYFNGVELDLVYIEDHDFFDVYHAPSKSYNLKFEDCINSIENIDDLKGIWLDIKNLNSENSEKILLKLLKILDARNIPHQNVLIETRFPEALPIFTKSGFKSCYYLPYFLYKKNNVELNSDISNIKNVLANQPNIAISSSHKDYDILREHFPNTPKYIWDLVWPVNIDFLLTRRLLKDDAVKVVLVHYKALKGNR